MLDAVMAAVRSSETGYAVHAPANSRVASTAPHAHFPRDRDRARVQRHTWPAPSVQSEYNVACPVTSTQLAPTALSRKLAELVDCGQNKHVTEVGGVVADARSS